MSSLPNRTPDQQSEHRLLEIRREAETRGRVESPGVTLPGAPFPHASPDAGYYGIPMLKPPQWKWEIPLYFFVGGAAGASAVIAAMADWVGHNPDLARRARLVAAGGAMLSSGLLIADLGRPSRFLNMLRVFKAQSPMSVGAWTLAAFSTASGAAAFAQLVRDRFDFAPVRIFENIASGFSALFGLPFSNYTGVLIGATAVPVWNANVKTLPLHFGMSGLNSSVGILELLGHDDSTALNILGMLATGIETWEGLHIETEQKEATKPLKRGFSGWLIRTGGVLSGPVPLLLRAISAITGSRRTRRIAAISGIAGSLVTRYAWMHAGKVSAKDYRLPLEIPAANARPVVEPIAEQIEEEREEEVA